MNPNTTTVITNWKRPYNVPRLIDAFRKQSAPTKIIIIDGGGDLSKDTLDSVDWWVRVSKNFGPYTRYMAAPFIDTEYSYFHDDDMMPGNRVIEHYLASEPESYAVLGQLGRLLDGNTYSAKAVSRGPTHRIVNNVVRSYFLQTKNLHWAQQFAHKRQYKLPWHDDLALCFSLRKYTGLPCALTPASSDRQEEACMEDLDDANGMWRRPGHFDERTEFCREALALGYEGVYWEN